MHMTYDQWMERTKLGVLSVRSPSLKSVDAALKNYDVFPSARHLKLLRRTLDIWKQEKVEWKKSDRNRKGAVTDLDAMLKGPDRELNPMDYRSRNSGSGSTCCSAGANWSRGSRR